MTNYLYAHVAAEQRAVDGSGWHQLDILSDKSIEALQNPDGDTADRPVRSIPSPLAPLHLTREALQRYVRQNGAVSEADRRTISDMLDVAVVLFNFEAYGQELDCLRYPLDDLAAWRDGGGPGAPLASATASFRDSDSSGYGFAKANALYLLTHRKTPNLVLGGTCPETMFFAAPGAKDWFDRGRAFGGDVLFDADYKLLEDRYDDFVVWVYALRNRLVAEDPTAATTSPFCKYVDYVVERRLPRLKPELNTLLRETVKDQRDYYTTNYPKLKTTAGEVLYVYGNVNLRGVNATLERAEGSDFLMALGAKRSAHDRVPLAIPQQVDRRATLVKGEVFDEVKHRPPLTDALPLDERRLPGLASRYPYLTVGDLFAEHIVQVPYRIDDEAWLSLAALDKGARPDNSDYLLPLTERFFEYFTAEELLSRRPGTPEFTCRLHGKDIECTLTLPVTGGQTVRFERQYKMFGADLQGRPSITPLTFGIALFPRFVDEANPRLQRLALLGLDNFAQLKRAAFVELVDTRGEGSPSTHTFNYRQDWKVSDSKHVVLMSFELGFDALRVASTAGRGARGGYLLPRLRAPVSTGISYSFAVDFGTTNTHVEMRLGTGTEQPFSIGDRESVTATLHPFLADGASAEARTGQRDRHGLDDDRGGFETQLFYHTRPNQLMPSRIGADKLVSFPIRTASLDHDGSINEQHVPLVHACIPFLYGRELYNEQEGDRVHTNLKWEAGTADDTRVRNDHTAAFIGELCMLMRARVRSGGGDPAATKLVWFYPVSMTTNQRGKLRTVWERAFREYFPEADAKANLRELPESLAPAYAWKKRGVLAETRPTIVLDIGGGTSDVTVLRTVSGKTEVVKVASYRYAGNTVFGDGGEVMAHNGFVNAFDERVTQLAIRKSGLSEVESAIRARGQGEDLVSFWFGLASDPTIDPPFDFARDLVEATSPMRVPFVLFFAALSFRIARDLAEAGVDAPQYLAFSGNGSRMLNFVSRDARALQRFFTYTFAIARGEAVEPRMPLMVVKHETKAPKQITARGGLDYLNKPDDLAEDFRNELDRTPDVETLRALASAPDTEVFTEVQAFAEAFRELVRAYDFPDLGIARSDFEPAFALLEDRARVRALFDSEVAEIVNSTEGDGESGRHPFFIVFGRLLPRVAERLAQQV